MSLFSKVLAKFQKTKKTKSKGRKLEIYARVYRSAEGKWYDLGLISKGTW